MAKADLAVLVTLDDVLKRFLAEGGQAFADIARERVRQDAQWGGAEHDDEHTGDDWNLYRSIFEGKILHVSYPRTAERRFERRRRLIQLAALAVAEVESLDRQERAFWHGHTQELALEDAGEAEVGA